MNIYALKGHKVTVTEQSAKNGYSHQQEKVRKLIGEIFTVEKTSVFSSVTYVQLKEFPTEWFNSVNFEDVDKQSKMKDKKHRHYCIYNESPKPNESTI